MAFNNYCYRELVDLPLALMKRLLDFGNFISPAVEILGTEGELGLVGKLPRLERLCVFKLSIGHVLYGVRVSSIDNLFGLEVF